MLHVPILARISSPPFFFYDTHTHTNHHSSSSCPSLSVSARLSPLFSVLLACQKGAPVSEARLPSYPPRTRASRCRFPPLPPSFLCPGLGLPYPSCSRLQPWRPPLPPPGSPTSTSCTRSSESKQHRVWLVVLSPPPPQQQQHQAASPERCFCLASVAGGIRHTLRSEGALGDLLVCFQSWGAYCRSLSAS